MLILTRKLGEQIAIGDNIRIKLVEIKGSQVKLGIEAPREVSIHRLEIYERIRSQNLESANVGTSDLLAATALINRNLSKGDTLED